MKHKHADNMLLYAQDAMETETPWERWELMIGCRWRAMTQCPAWNPDNNYRRKPRTIRIGKYDVPEPMREAPECGSEYFVISITSDCKMAYQETWDGDQVDAARLERGLCHSTREAAEIHAKALISLTAKP